MEIEIGRMGRQEKYKLLIGCVVPRPIAWISSISAEGVINVAPFSFFNVACIDPMMISVSVGRKAGGVPKDTARNIRETGEFVVNMVDVYNVDLANQTSADYPSATSEAEAVGLTLVPAKTLKVPRIGESRIHFECKLHQALTFGEPAQADFLIGEVLHVQVADELYRDGKIDIETFAPVSRLAGHSYARIGEQFERPRPVYPAEHR
jgi:flavin reductase (DIM6/NTAB) family NADH-FMN oxidoreductase RutF